jgi:hypothetical protein
VAPPAEPGQLEGERPYQLAGWVVAAGVFSLLLQGVRYGLSLALDEPELYTPWVSSASPEPT